MTKQAVGPISRLAEVKSRRGLLAVSGLVLMLDQITKTLVVQYLPLHEVWPPLPAWGWFFRLVYIQNTGAAFGLFPKSSPIFTIMAVLVILGLVYYYPHFPIEHGGVRLSLGLQLGGALGNLVDRLRYNYVVDFIGISFWPICNLADLSIVAGILLLALHWVKRRE